MQGESSRVRRRGTARDTRADGNRARLGRLCDLSQRLSRHRQGDEYSSYVLAEWASHLFVRDLPFSEYGLRWHRDEEFWEYYRRYALEPATAPNLHSADRKYFMRSLLGMAAAVPGDMAECGVYRGATARLMALASTGDCTLHLFDSFEGLSAPGANDGSYWTSNDLRSSPDAVRAALSDVSTPIEVHAGWIPDRFTDVEDRQFCFVHIDVDLYEPTLASLQFFYPRLSAGGILLLDDYGFETCPGARAATDEWIRVIREPLVDVPTGQAFLVKR